MANNPCSGNSGWGNGSDGNNGLAKSTPFLTLQYAMAQMSANDTLIIDDGTYTGTSNVLNSTNRPPDGTGGSFTTIKAENDGEVLFDGEDSRSMFVVTYNGTNWYWSFEGLIWANSSGSTVTLNQTDEYPSSDAMYVKFLRCGAYNASDGNTTNFYIFRGSYVLLEECYAYGTGRYKFQVYRSDHVVVRKCVARHDQVDTSGAEPTAGFSVYQSHYVEVQNCIAVDGDQSDAWSATDWQGAFAVFTTNGTATNINFKKCIGLNNHYGALTIADTNATSNVTMSDMVLWDCDNNDAVGFNLGLNIKGSQGATGDEIEHIVYGSSSIYGNWGLDFPSITNSVFYNLTLENNFWAWGVPTTNDYNAYYSNTNNTGRTGSNDLTTTNPTTNSLLYLPRIESGSDLIDAGDGGTYIGAQVDNMIGTSETFWGDSGYATETETSMWPFPNEGLIKSKMAAYTWDDGGGGDPEIDGARGFAAGAETLTKYIWEYLGNTIPCDIYGTCGNPTSTGSISGSMH